MYKVNKFLVRVHGIGDEIEFYRPVPLKISKDDAVNLAAWLIIFADIQEEVLKLVSEIDDY